MLKSVLLCSKCIKFPWGPCMTWPCSLTTVWILPEFKTARAYHGSRLWNRLLKSRLIEPHYINRPILVNSISRSGVKIVKSSTFNGVAYIPHSLRLFNFSQDRKIADRFAWCFNGDQFKFTCESKRTTSTAAAARRHNHIIVDTRTVSVIESISNCFQ